MISFRFRGIARLRAIPGARSLLAFAIASQRIGPAINGLLSTDSGEKPVARSRNNERYSARSAEGRAVRPLLSSPVPPTLSLFLSLALSRITRSVTRGRGVPGEKINGLRALCVNVIRFPCAREPRRPTYPQCDITRSSAGNTVRSAGRGRLGPITNFHYSILI